MAILVVRHADAGNRDRWEGPDHARPLSARGLAQANRLVAALGAFTPGRVLSSPYVRCTQTVQPLVAARGLAVEQSEALAEGAGGAAIELVMGLAAAGTPDVVLCTHGDVVGDLLDALALAGVALPDDLRLRKGSTWVLAIGGGRVVGARYMDRPAV